jgi:hypothetical protein
MTRLDKNFRDMLSALNDVGAEYLVVGAHALGAYGRIRATGDFDIWIRTTPENVERVWKAIEVFGAPRRKLTKADLCVPGNIYQIGVAPYRIDIVTSITGVEFADAWRNRHETQLDGMNVAVLSRDDLLKNKRATGRTKDLLDAAWLEEHGK